MDVGSRQLSFVGQSHPPQPSHSHQLFQVSFLQVASHQSPFFVFQSSHCSVLSMIQFPQLAGVLVM